jgi:hypothetical protein
MLCAESVKVVKQFGDDYDDGDGASSNTPVCYELQFGGVSHLVPVRGSSEGGSSQRTFEVLAPLHESEAEK